MQAPFLLKITTYIFELKDFFVGIRQGRSDLLLIISVAIIF